MLLDCNIQTRFTEKQKKLGRKTGHTEILARGQRMQESNGKVKECDGDFTDALVSNLQSLIEDLNAGKRKGTTKPASISRVQNHALQSDTYLVQPDESGRQGLRLPSLHQPRPYQEHREDGPLLLPDPGREREA